jgi:ribonuclease BN (tRNA processing enzyme)
MDPVHFPVSQERLPASFSFATVEPGPWEIDGIRIRTMAMRHPSRTLGYRLETAGRVAVFIPDNEIEGGPFPVVEGWRQELEEFVEGADALFHDAMFTADEGEPFEGWGHSTFEEVFELASGAGVKRLYFFHHAPDRTDGELDAIVASFQRRAENLVPGMTVQGAREGEIVQL